MGSGCVSNGVIDFAAMDGDVYHPLPAVWQAMLDDGELYTALVLSTVYTDKRRGRRMSEGDIAEIKLPAGLGNWTPMLLSKVGHTECAIMLWLGDASCKEKTVYIAFMPLRNLRHFFRMFRRGCGRHVELAFSEHSESCSLGSAGAVEAVAEHVEALPGRCEKQQVSISLRAYIKSQLDLVWESLQAAVLRASRSYPDHRLLVAGISYGAVMSQACTFRLAVEHPALNLWCVAWNSMRWTDIDGAKLVSRALGGRLLSLVLSRRRPGAQRVWDPCAGFPPAGNGEWAFVPHAYLLDADSGRCLPASHVPGFPGDYGRQLRHMRCFHELHFARAVISAIRVRMHSVASGAGAEPHASPGEPDVSYEELEHDGDDAAQLSGGELQQRSEPPLGGAAGAVAIAGPDVGGPCGDSGGRLGREDHIQPCRSAISGILAHHCQNVASAPSHVTSDCGLKSTCCTISVLMCVCVDGATHSSCVVPHALHPLVHRPLQSSGSRVGPISQDHGVTLQGRRSKYDWRAQQGRGRAWGCGDVLWWVKRKRLQEKKQLVHSHGSEATCQSTVAASSNGGVSAYHADDAGPAARDGATRAEPRALQRAVERGHASSSGVATVRAPRRGQASV